MAKTTKSKRRRKDETNYKKQLATAKQQIKENEKATKNKQINSSSKSKQKSKTKARKNTKSKKIYDIYNLMNRGAYNMAMYEVMNYLAENPSDTTGHYLYGKLLLRQYYQQTDLNTNPARQTFLTSARREFQYVIEHQDEHEVKSLMLLATIARLEGNPDEAIGYYKKVIEDSNYEDIYAINVLAHLERKEKRYESALETLSLTDEHSFALEIERAKTLSLLGKNEESLKILNALEPKTIDEEREKALNQGRNAKENEDYDKATFYYEFTKEHGDKDDLYYRAIYEQIKLALDYEKYDEAKDYCESLLEAKKMFKGETLLFLGIIEQALGNYDNAYNCYKETTEIATDRDVKSSAFYHAGSLEFAKGQFAEAEISFKRSASTARVPSKDTYTKLIGVLFRQQKYEETIKYLDRVKKQNPLWTDPDTHLGYMHMLANKRLGYRLPKSSRNELNYAERQIVKYSEQEAIEHIKSHHQMTTNNSTRGNFGPHIDIDNLYYTIRTELSKDDLVNEDAMETYEIDYYGVGYNLENKLVDRVRVVVFPHTRNILTMYPGCKATVPRQGEFKTSLKPKVHSKDQDKKQTFTKNSHNQSN